MEHRSDTAHHIASPKMALGPANRMPRLVLFVGVIATIGNPARSSLTPNGLILSVGGIV
jgi:hypothetical protein